MRLIKITGPQGSVSDLRRLAFSVGIDSISVHKVEKHEAVGGQSVRDVVDITTSTPKAKHFIDTLLNAEFFDREKFSLNIRQPRSIITSGDIHELTRPLEEPPLDLSEELWQFSHFTYGLAGRIFIAASLLAYGLIQQQILLMIGGLLFLPLLPMLMAIGFGTITGQFRLVLQGATALALSVLLLLGVGSLVAALSHPPLLFNDFNSVPVGLAISLAVGIAAGLAAIDDTGRRELIGLAAAAQIGILPVSLGISFVFGTPVGEEGVIYTRIFSLIVNVAMILAGSVAVQLFGGMAHSGLSRIETKV